MDKISFDAVMLIDDDNATNFFNKVMLEEWEVSETFHSFAYANKALAFILDNQENIQDNSSILILIDVNMPRMDGFQFLEEFSKLSTQLTSKFAIIMMSSVPHPRQDEAVTAYDALKGFMVKPIELQQLEQIFIVA